MQLVADLSLGKVILQVMLRIEYEAGVVAASSRVGPGGL